ncbi:MAG: hypothetical protein GYA12_05600, partial [Chloroflexi bacterium]|nr:hypothetical protein [Chloroflexota bacterium]
MKRRTNQMLLTFLAVYLVIFSCRFLSDVNTTNEPETRDQTDSGSVFQPLTDGIDRLFGGGRQDVDIGGVVPRGFSLVGQLG